MSPPSDNELLQQLQTHQPQSLTYLYDTYGDLMYGLAYRLLNNRQESEDLVQEVFAQLWQRCTYDPKRSSFKSFLMLLVRSRAIDRLRASKTHQNRALQTEGWRFSEGENFPLEAATHDEVSQRVKLALAELPESQRQALELSYFRGLTQAEIAEQLAVPLGTVKSWFRLSFTKLRQSLQDFIP